MRELTRAVSNAPSDAPPNYVEAVQRLQAVLYGERKEKEEQEEVSPTRNPSQGYQNTRKEKEKQEEVSPQHNPSQGNQNMPVKN
eukprot:6059020-Ditylum_brightwellii.AAC.1